MDLYKLPKDILIEIIKKSFNFSKLSVDDVDRLHGLMNQNFKKRYSEEIQKNEKLMGKRYMIGNVVIDLAIAMQKMYVI